MSLEYVIGPSGSGKSTYVFERMLALAKKEPERSFLIIVPEQFTMVTQRRLVSISEEKCILNVEVLSFERLAYRVFDELGSDTRSVLGDTGKMLLLKKAAFLHMDDLKVLGRNMKKRGYLDHVKSLISEFEQYRIGPDDLEKMCDISAMPHNFSEKISDLRILYEEFLNLIKDKYITSEMILDMLCDVVDESAMVKDSYIVFDGYTGFTPVQINLIKRLMKLSEKMTVTVTGDEDMALFTPPVDQELFAMSKKMITALNRIAKRESIEILPAIRLGGDDKRHAGGSALSHLEKNLFRSRSEKYNKNADESVKLYRLSDTRRELRFVAEEIHKLVRTGGYSYKDIAVVCPDLSEYRNFAAGIFEKTKIPVFIDEKTDIIFDPFLEFIYGAFDVVIYDFDRDGLMRMLRSGLCGIDMRQTDLIENYLRSSGLRGRNAYAHVFARTPRGYEPSDLININETISSFRENIVKFNDRIKASHTTKDMLIACYELIIAFDVWDQLPEKKLYEFMMDLMDQMNDLLGDEESTFSDFVDLFKNGMSESSIGKIPMTSDSVIFGDIERSRLWDIKVLFLIGACDHAIPKSNGSKGILSQSERLILADNDFELAPTDRERAFMQRFYLYLILTKPSERLYITYSNISSGKEAVGPSYIVGIIKAMFDLSVCDIKDDDPGVWTETKEEAFDLLLTYLRNYAAGSLEKEKEPVLFGLCDLMRKNGEEERLNRALESVFFKHTDVALAKEVMDAVYGSIVRISVSRLESYASCAYAYYLQYLLRLHERREHTFEAADMGSLYHSALENYSRLLKESGYTWHNVPDDALEGFIDKGIESSIMEFERAELFDRARERYVADNIKKTMKRSIFTLTKQIRQGEFEPKYFEVSLEEIEGADNLKMRLSNGKNLWLSGKIDRVDTFETEDTVYVKIIDYKSGGKDIDLSSVYYGLSVQLFVYMGAALASEKHENKDTVPAGFFYYHIHDPYIDADISAPDDKIEGEIFKALKVKGRINGEGDIPQLFDRDIDVAAQKNTNYSSPVIPYAITKSGEASKTSKVLTKDNIEDLISYVAFTEKEIGEKISSGVFDVNPYKDDSGNSGCKYCSYHSICGFDEKIDGYSYKKIEKLDDDEVIKRISKIISKDNETENGQS